MAPDIQKNFISLLKDIDHKKIVLFGSRARGDSAENSDYDLLIEMNDDIPLRRKMLLSSQLRKRFAKKGYDVDVILKSTREIEYLKDKTGSVVKAAMNEGMLIDG